MNLKNGTENIYVRCSRGFVTTKFAITDVYKVYDNLFLILPVCRLLYIDYDNLLFILPVCGQYLVSGTRPVEDDQLSESSRWCDLNLSKSFCQPPEMRYLAAKYARLNSTGLYTGGWATAVVNQHQYVQVHVLIILFV